MSTAEQAMLCILSIVRNYPTGLLQIRNGGWDIAEVSSRAYDIENKVVGIVGAGRIGQLIMERLKVGAAYTVFVYVLKSVPELIVMHDLHAALTVCR